jgi:two-component system response regulator YesN
MLLDDEPWQLKGMGSMIPWEEGGFEVAYALDNSAGALEILLSEKIDVLLTDIRMPGLNGLELLASLRAKGIETEVVFLSGYAEFDYAREALKMGAYDYLLKPFDTGEMPAFLAKLREHLARKEHVDSLLRHDRVINSGKTAEETGEDRLIKAMVQFVDLNFSRPISLKDMALHCHTNTTTASRIFKQRMGSGFVKYLTALRIKKAAEYLEKTELSIEEICSHLGYMDYFYFHKVFKKQTGKTPHQYRGAAKRNAGKAL